MDHIRGGLGKGGCSARTFLPASRTSSNPSARILLLRSGQASSQLRRASPALRDCQLPRQWLHENTNLSTVYGRHREDYSGSTKIPREAEDARRKAREPGTESRAGFVVWEGWGLRPSCRPRLRLFFLSVFVRRSSPSHRIDPHQSIVQYLVPRTATPHPIPRRRDQSTRRWISMHVFQLLHLLLAIPHIEIVRPPLPELRHSEGCPIRRICGWGF
jgi:hypothetical protein